MKIRSTQERVRSACFFWFVVATDDDEDDDDYGNDDGDLSYLE